MRRECPEFGGGGGGREGGVKAVPQARDRSPCPGGLGSTLDLRRGYVTEGGPHSPRQRRDGHFEGFRRGSAEGEDESASIWRTLKSPCGFVLQSTGGELVTPRNCPELSSWDGAEVGGDGSRSRAEGNGVRPRIQGEWLFCFGDPGCRRPLPLATRVASLRDAPVGIGVRGVSAKRIGLCHPSRVVMFLLGYQGWLHATPGYSNGIPPGCGKAPPCTLFQTPEYLERVGMAISQDTGNERVTCMINAMFGVVLEAGTDAECNLPCPEVAFASPWPSRVPTAEHEQGVVRRVSSSPAGCHSGGERTWCQVQVSNSGAIPGWAAAPQSRCSFVLEEIGGELLIPQDCPEFSDRDVVETLGVTSSGPACVTPSSTLSARDEDAGTPAGVLRAGEGRSGGIAALNHRLPAGKPPASSDHRRLHLILTPEYLEWVWKAISQGTGNERVTCMKNAKYRVGLVNRRAGRVTQGIGLGLAVPGKGS